MIVAMFSEEAALVRAVRQFHAANVGPIETYTPAPLPDAPTASPIPLIILAAGLIGGAFSFWLQSFSATVAYRFSIGGRPRLSWASFIPTTWENAALIAVVAGFAAFLAINRMPRLYDKVDEALAMRRASRDRWVLQVATSDDAATRHARVLIAELGPVSVEELPD